MADGFVELSTEKLATHEGVRTKQTMISVYKDNEGKVIGYYDTQQTLSQERI